MDDDCRASVHHDLCLVVKRRRAREKTEEAVCPVCGSALGCFCKTAQQLLTPEELEVLALTAVTAGKIHKIIGDGPNSYWDWAEAAHHIHNLQHMVMSQAAARAYPEMFRLLGGTLDGPEKRCTNISAVPPTKKKENQVSFTVSASGHIGDEDFEDREGRVRDAFQNFLNEAQAAVGNDSTVTGGFSDRTGTFSFTAAAGVAPGAPDVPQADGGGEDAEQAEQAQAPEGGGAGAEAQSPEA